MESIAMLTFPSTHHAILAEQALLDRGLEVGVMPMPAQLSSGCGICLHLPLSQVGRVSAIFEEEQVQVEAWYEIDLSQTDAVAYRQLNKKRDGDSSLRL